MASNTSQAGQAGSHHQSGLVSLNVGGGTLVISEILRRFKPLVLCLQGVLRDRLETVNSRRVIQPLINI